METVEEDLKRRGMVAAFLWNMQIEEKYGRNGEMV